MDIQGLKTAIIKQIDQLQSEDALREVDRFLHALAIDKAQSSAANQEDGGKMLQADDVFAKAVEKYHTLLQKLAQ